MQSAGVTEFEADPATPKLATYFLAAIVMPSSHKNKMTAIADIETRTKRHCGERMSRVWRAGDDNGGFSGQKNYIELCILRLNLLNDHRDLLKARGRGARAKRAFVAPFQGAKPFFIRTWGFSPRL